MDKRIIIRKSNHFYLSSLNTIIDNVRCNMFIKDVILSKNNDYLDIIYEEDITENNTFTKSIFINISDVSYTPHDNCIGYGTFLKTIQVKSVDLGYTYNHYGTTHDIKDFYGNTISIKNYTDSDIKNILSNSIVNNNYVIYYNENYPIEYIRNKKFKRILNTIS